MSPFASAWNFWNGVFSGFCVMSASSLRSADSCWKRFTNQLRVGEPPAKDRTNYFQKSPRVIFFAMVESERLFVQIAEQMKWFNTYVGSTQRAFK